MGWTLTTWWNLPDSEKNFWFADDYRRQEKLNAYTDKVVEKGKVMDPDLLQLMLLLEST